MKLTKNKFQDRRIFNPYGLADLQDEPKVFVDWSPQLIGRMSRSAKWAVVGIGFATNPVEALAWATESEAKRR